ncbi:MAG TPA: DUF5671 domain-containing protein [Patescibacteria group bacterium]|nr:DUF5671 domain-containing protein [Patescibacteria group bacterium]
MENNNHGNAAKFAFFYLLSLVALLFMSLSTGMILFQVINKFIASTPGVYSGDYSSEALRFAISSLVVAIPIFYVISAQIHKNLYQGNLSSESGIRKWLTYFILFVSSVVMIVWLIITINSFLDGELTLKFGLKFLSVLAIAGTIFGFYFYDIKRDNVQGTKDPVIKSFFGGTLALVVIIFASGLFIMESPWQVRAKNLDREVLRDLNSLQSRVERYYRENNVLPANLETILQEYSYLDQEDISDPESGKKYEYQITGDRTYQLCADFRTSGEDDDYYLGREWSHDKGYKCFELEVEEEDNDSTPTPRVIQ